MSLMRGTSASTRCGLAFYLHGTSAEPINVPHLGSGRSLVVEDGLYMENSDPTSLSPVIHRWQDDQNQS